MYVCILVTKQICLYVYMQYAYACTYVFWPPNKFVCMYAICICMYVFWPPNKSVCIYVLKVVISERYEAVKCLAPDNMFTSVQHRCQTTYSTYVEYLAIEVHTYVHMHIRITAEPAQCRHLGTIKRVQITEVS
jgi:hypothetical protein